MSETHEAICDFPGCQTRLSDPLRILCPVHWGAIPRPTLRRAVEAANRNDLDTVRQLLIDELRSMYGAKGTN